MFDSTPLLKLASTQHGLVSRDDLDEHGVTPKVMHRLIRRGLLTRICRRAFRSTGSVDDDHQRVLAACLEQRGAATASTALWLHGIPGFGPPGNRNPEVISLEARCQYRPATGRSRTSTLFDERCHVLVDGIPTLRIEWALFSLAAQIPGVRAHGFTEGFRLRLRNQLANAIDNAVQEGHCTDQQLWDLLSSIRCPGRNGVREFEAVLDSRLHNPTESHLERRFLELLRGAGLPLPACQQRVESQDGLVARVDFRYVGSDTVIEVLGHAHHSSLAQLDADAHRQSRLALVGISVLAFTYRQVTTQPHQVLAMVRAHLAGLRGRASPAAA